MEQKKSKRVEYLIHILINIQKKNNKKGKNSKSISNKLLIRRIYFPDYKKNKSTSIENPLLIKKNKGFLTDKGDFSDRDISNDLQKKTDFNDLVIKIFHKRKNNTYFNNDNKLLNFENKSRDNSNKKNLNKEVYNKILKEKIKKNNFLKKIHSKNKNEFHSHQNSKNN